MSNLKLIITALLVLAGSSGLNYFFDIPEKRVQKILNTQKEINKSENVITDLEAKGDVVVYEVFYTVERIEKDTASGPGRPDVEFTYKTYETKRILIATDRDFRALTPEFLQGMKIEDSGTVRAITKVSVLLM